MLMESIAIPLSFVVLVWVFGGLLAAALPVAVGGFAILGSMAVMRGITLFTDVSIFALNLTVAMGLALAIDYTLLIISRFRDELASGAGREEALSRTMATAGRTVLFSAMTVALSMAAMVLFPMYFLKSFAYAGIATVVFAIVAAVVVTPAVIVLLGDRLDSLDVRRLGRWLLRRPEPTPRPVERTFWYRLNEIRDAPRDSDRAGGHRAAARAGSAVPGHQMGLSRRSRAAGDRSRHARSAMTYAAISRSTLATNVTVVIPDSDRGEPPPSSTVTHAAAVAGSRRVIGVVAGRHVRHRHRVGRPRRRTGSATAALS